MYNDVDVMTVQELKEKTNITDDFLKPALIQLCNPKVRVLDKAVKKPTFDDPNEQIKLNMKFTSNNIRVNLIPVASTKKKAAAPDEKDQRQAKEVQTERKVTIVDTVWKIMKTRKTVAYQELITENMSMIQMFKA